ncbi:MAG: hypothetical protein GXP50_04165, partial [Deltaproteobacteria bacterium]|nr:hypothetical protein [Deltaproteobacteria bacterium]
MNIPPFYSEWRPAPSLRSTRGRRIAFAAAGALFVVGVAASASNLHVSPANVRWGYLAGVALLGFPGTFLLNAAELHRVGRVTGAPFRFLEALKVVLLAAAANLLPLPGAAITRVAAFRAKGITYRKGGGLVLGLFFLWAGLAGLLLGGAIAIHGNASAGMAAGVG